jgi:AcrR family transcriptional regulator
MNWGNQYQRNETARQAILAAALEVCRDMGYAATSIEAIARRAEVGKQTIYRWWPSKGLLLLDALQTRAGETTTFPDTGDIVADMAGQIHAVGRLFSHPELAPVVRAILAGRQSDPAVAERFLGELLEPRRTSAEHRLTLAVERGELPPEPGPAHLIELLYAPLYYRLLVTHEPLDATYVEAHLAAVFAVVRRH